MRRRQAMFSFEDTDLRGDARRLVQIDIDRAMLKAERDLLAPRLHDEARRRDGAGVLADGRVVLIDQRLGMMPITQFVGHILAWNYSATSAEDREAMHAVLTRMLESMMFGQSESRADAIEHETVPR